jgi:hypothetical protein
MTNDNQVPQSRDVQMPFASLVSCLDDEIGGQLNAYTPAEKAESTGMNK